MMVNENFGDIDGALVVYDDLIILVTLGNPQRCKSMIAKLSIQLNLTFMWVCLHWEFLLQ